MLHAFIRNKALEDSERATGWKATYDEKQGFSDDAVDAWLSTQKNLSLQEINKVPIQCPNFDIILNNLTATHSCNSFLCRGQNHSFAIIKHENTWKLLNSLQNKPLDITLKANQDHTSCLTQRLTIYVIVPATEEGIINSVEQQQPPLNPRPYMEKQEKVFCLVHSFNMAIGEHNFSGKQVLAHIHKMEDTLEQLKVYNQSLDHFYTKNMGNSNSNFLNKSCTTFLYNNDLPLDQRKRLYAEICPILRIQRRRDHGRCHKPVPKRSRF
jgi:hypothetical protein